MSTSKKYDVLVFVARLQPLHNAHAEIIRRACLMTRELIIVVGSANQPRTFKNPFTSKERQMMIENVLAMQDNRECRVFIEHNEDTIYDDNAWATRVQGIVSKYRLLGGTTGIIGHRKDETSAYLNMFPQWELEDVELIEPLHAVNIRDLYFKSDCNMNFIRGVVPQPTFRLLDGWKDTPDFNQIVREREFTEQYKRQWAGCPYPVIFSTADALVVQSAHVLLVKRRAEPGKNLWAMPGGYVNALTDRSVQDAMVRELREETGLKVPTPVLVGNIKGSKVFDAIDRSPRGRIITHCFHIELPPGELPRVKGSDDAEKAQWVPLSEVKSALMFEDHYQILQVMLGSFK